MRGEAEIRDQLADKKIIGVFGLGLEQRYQSEDAALSSLFGSV